MGVVDAKTRGGTVPEPQEPERSPSKPEPEFVDKVLAARRKAQEQDMEFQAVKQVLGEGRQPPVEQPIKITATLDIGQILQDSQETLRTMATRAEGETKAQITELQEKVAKALKTLENPPERKSPLEVYREVRGEIDSLANEVKQNLGLGANVNVGTADFPRLLELEDRRLDREERERRWKEEQDRLHHQWELEAEERRRRYEQEDRKWAAEMALRQQEFQDRRDVQRKAGDGLSDLVGAVIEGIDTERTGTEVGQEVIVPQRRLVKSFPCEACQARVQVPREAKEGDIVECPSCHAQYVLEVQKSGAAPQTEPAEA